MSTELVISEVLKGLTQGFTKGMDIKEKRAAGKATRKTAASREKREQKESAIRFGGEYRTSEGILTEIAPEDSLERLKLGATAAGSGKKSDQIRKQLTATTLQLKNTSMGIGGMDRQDMATQRKAAVRHTSQLLNDITQLRSKLEQAIAEESGVQPEPDVGQQPTGGQPTDQLTGGVQPEKPIIDVATGKPFEEAGQSFAAEKREEEKELLANKKTITHPFFGDKVLRTSIAKNRAEKSLKDDSLAIQTMDDLLDITAQVNANPALRADLALKSKAKVAAGALFGRLRLALIGPGAISDEERAFLMAVIPDPTKILSLSSMNKAKLETLRTMIKRASVVEIIIGGGEISDDEIKEYGLDPTRIRLGKKAIYDVKKEFKKMVKEDNDKITKFMEVNKMSKKEARKHLKEKGFI